MNVKPAAATTEGQARVRNIVYAYGYSDKTKGDLGISCGAMEMLSRLYPRARIVVLRWLGDDRTEAYQDTLERMYGVQQLRSCLPIKRLQVARDLEGMGRRDWLGILRQALVLGEDLWGLGLSAVAGPGVARALVGRDLRATIQAIAEADLVVTKPGGYLSSPTLYTDFQTLLPGTYACWLAKQLRRPLAIIGHSIWAMTGPFSHRILKPLVDYSLVTTCREHKSYDYLVGAGYSRDKVRLAPCPSFAMAKAPDERGREILAAEGLADLGRPLVGVSICYQSFGRDPQLRRLRGYLTAMAETALALWRNYGALAVVVPQNIAPGSAADNDQVVNDMFVALVNNQDAVHVVETEYTPQELMALYGHFRIFVGTRLHACIFAMRAHTPVLSVAYHPHKHAGVMHMAGMADYVVDINEVSGPELTEKAARLWGHRDQVRTQLAQSVSVMERDVWNNAIWLDEALAAHQSHLQ